MPSLRPTASAVVRLSPVSITTRIRSSRSAFSAPMALSLIGSATATSPAAASSTATSITPWPSLRNASARSGRPSGSIPSEAKSAWLPTAIRLPSTVPTTPLPVSEVKSAAAPRLKPRSSAPLTTASASGCSLLRSRLATSRNKSSSSTAPSRRRWRGAACLRSGSRSCRRPAVSTFSISSSASAFLMRTPAQAPRPVPTMIDIGVANPSAQGQAMIKHGDGVDESRSPSPAPGPNIDQTMNVTTAAAMTRRYEPAGDGVGERLDRRARTLGLGHHLDDPGQQGVAADPLGAHDEGAGAVDGAAGHFVAGRFLERERVRR